MKEFFAVITFGLFIGLVTDGELGTRIWNAKWMLELRFNTHADKIHRQKRPHDCDFLTAPMGIKYCLYEPNITADPNDEKIIYLDWIRKES